MLSNSFVVHSLVAVEGGGKRERGGDRDREIWMDRWMDGLPLSFFPLLSENISVVAMLCA